MKIFPYIGNRLRCQELHLDHLSKFQQSTSDIITPIPLQRTGSSNDLRHRSLSVLGARALSVGSLGSAFVAIHTSPVPPFQFRLQWGFWSPSDLSIPTVCIACAPEKVLPPKTARSHSPTDSVCEVGILLKLSFAILSLRAPLTFFISILYDTAIHCRLDMVAAPGLRN